MARWTKAAAPVIALVMLGAGGWVAAPAVAASTPGRPVVVPASGNGWVSAKWSAASANGKAIVGYQFASRRYFTSSGTWTGYAYSTLGASTRSRGVAAANGTRLQMLVRARNGLGYGPWGIVSSVAGLPAAVPGTAASAGDGSIAVSWSPASGNGSPITGYRVYSRHYAGGAWSPWSYRTAGALSRTAVVTGLTNDRTHQFFVRAVNSRGTGAPGSTIAARPVAAPAPTPPSTAPPSTAPPTTAPPTTAPPTMPAQSAEVTRILNDTNAFRAANGKAPLAAMPALDVIANQWAQKMHDECIFEHRSSFDVYPAGWSRAGENIAAGYSYTSVVQGWIDSPGHRANMLGDYTHIGIGYHQGSKCYRTYFVQNFARY